MVDESKKQMTARPLKEITTPLARELAEYILLRHDLELSFHGLKLWFAKYAEISEPTAEQQILSQALFRDAIILFMGCFDKTAPLKLSKMDLYGQLDGGLEFFEWLQAMRDAYAAHKFGAYRQCVVGILTDDQESSVAGTGHLWFMYHGPPKDSKDQFLRFIGVAGRHVEDKVKQLEAALLETAKKMSAEELASLKAARVHGVDPDMVRMSRATFRRALSSRPRK